MTKKVIWIGLVSLRASRANQILNGRKGAFTNVLALASDGGDFAQIVEDALEKLGFKVEEIEDSEPFSLRIATTNPNEELRNLAEKVEATKLVQVGLFHTYPDDDLNS